MIWRAIVSKVSPISLISPGALVSDPACRMRRPSGEAAHPPAEVADRVDHELVDGDQRHRQADEPHGEREGHRREQTPAAADRVRAGGPASQRIGAPGRDRDDRIVALAAAEAVGRELAPPGPCEILEPPIGREDPG
jgi:hypothetical protein